MVATSPISNIFYPEGEIRSRLCAAKVDVGAGGGGAAVTLTIDNAYPPIDRSVQSPVVAILMAQAGATLVANGNEGFDITGHCDGTPDSAGEFQITGDRTIKVYQQANEAQDALVLYYGKGSGQKV